MAAPMGMKRVAPVPADQDLADPGAFYKSQPGALNNPCNTIPENEVWRSSPMVYGEQPLDDTTEGVVLEIDLQDLQPVTPPDGGWGWFVALGSFMCMFLVDGICFSYGIFLSELETTFEASKTQITLGGALLTGCYFMVGPIASGLMNRFGARPLVIFGSLLSSVGIIASTFAQNLPVFVGTFGVLGGIGFGLTYVPAATVVTAWFVKKRATVTGLTTAGSAIGLTCYSLLIPNLIHMFTWRGCILILAAINLNGAVAGALLRPLTQPDQGASEKKRFYTNAMDSVPDGGKEASEPIVPKPSGTPTLAKQANTLTPRSKSNIQQLARLYVESTETSDANPTQAFESNPALSIGGLSDGVFRQTGRRDVSRKSNTSWDDIIITHGNQLVPLPEGSALTTSNAHLPKLSMEAVNHIVEGVLNRQALVSSTNLSAADQPVKKKSSAFFAGSQRWLSSTQSQLGQVSVQPSENAVVYLKPDNMGSTSYFTSAISLKAIPEAGTGVIDEQAFRDAVVRELRKEVARPVHRKDLFLSGSLIHIDEYLATPDVQAYIRHVTAPAEETQARSPILAMLRSMFGVSILRSPTFHLLNVSSMITMMGYIVPYQFIKDTAQHHGYVEAESAYLLAYLGILNTVGRLVSGWLSDRPWINVLLVNNVSLLVSGAVTALVPLLKTYTALLSYACIFGFIIAPFIAVRTILIVELLGLDRLSNAFGFLLLFQGVAVAIAPPMLGSIYDAFGNFDLVFLFGGIALFVSGLLCLPLSTLARAERRKELQDSDWEDEPENGCIVMLTKAVRFIRDICILRCFHHDPDVGTKSGGARDITLYNEA